MLKKSNVTYSVRVYGKLGQIILLEKIIKKYLVFVPLFSTQILSKQANLFVSYTKPIPFFKVKECQQILSNTVKIVSILGHFWWYFSHFYMFLHYLTLTNKKTNNYSFWIHFSDLNQIIFSFWFVGIWHYLTYYGESCWSIHFESFRFNLF